MKDVPTELPAGTSIRAHPKREDPRDIYATVTGGDLDSLPEDATIGTSSLRRIAQINAKYPKFKCVSIRGNIQTRRNKLGTEVDAVILAAAGIKRMGMQNQMHGYLEVSDVLPAVAQGTLGIQTKDDNDEVNRMVDALNDADTVDRTLAERAFLARLEGGCQVPIGAYATLDGDTLHLDGLVGSVDGKTLIRRQVSGARSDAKSLGIQLADTILDLGAREILQALYESQGHG